MKKRLLLFMMSLFMVISCISFSSINVDAASYPYAFILNSDSTPTIPEGEIGYIGLTIFPEYKNERYNVEIYDSNNNMVGSLSTDYYTSSYGPYVRDVKITINTKDLNMTTGKYKVVYWLDFYTLYSWHSTPSKSTYTFEVIKNTCKGKHNLKKEKVITEPTCEDEGKALYNCTKCKHITYKTLAKKHNYNSGVTKVKPTPTKAGQTLYTCKTCGATKTSSIPTSYAVKIKTQPKSPYAKAGEDISVTVKASGKGLKYTWYVKSKGSSKYTKSSVTSKTYTVKMSEKAKDRNLYCIVKDKYGNKERSKTVKLHMNASILKQPANASAAKGKKAKFEVKAGGEGLKYQWYVKNKGSSTYKKLSTTDSTYYCEMSSKTNGRSIYCVVKDKFGNSVKSKVVTATMK